MIKTTQQINTSEYVRAGLLHVRSQLQFRILPLLGVLVLLVGVGFVFLDATKGLAAGFPLMLMGVMLLLSRRFIAWQLKRQFSRLPANNEEVTWTIADAGISAKGATFEFSQTWVSFMKCIGTGSGFLLYPQEGIFYWLPRSWFSEADYLRLCEIMRKNVRNYVNRESWL